MRRLKENHDKERGSAGVLIAAMMLVLMGAGAMAVDVGQIYAERAQLQNAADAGAMAVAQRCRDAGGCTVTQATAWAAELSGANSNDGASDIASVDLSVPRRVTVATSTRNGVSGAGFLTQMFSHALNAPAVTVGARATAGFDPPSSGSGFPLAISAECYNLSASAATGAVQKFSYKPGGTCTGPSGAEIPGGWGWLDQSSPCEAATTTGSNDLGSDPGNNPPAGCSTILTGWRATMEAGGEVTVTLPIFDDDTNAGQNGSFHIMGYATLKIWGWKFGNNHEYEFRNTADDPGMNSSLACAQGQARCIIGQFVRFESIDSAGGTPGTGADLGTVDIRLIR